MPVDIQSLWQSISSFAGGFFSSIDIAQHPYYLLDILIVSLTFYYVYVLLRGTRAIPIVMGLVIVAVVSVISQWLKLSALTWLLTHFLTLIAIAIPVIFHEEIRRGLEMLGQARALKAKGEPRGIQRTVRAIVDTCDACSTGRIGALIVLKREVNLGEVIETGIPLNADVSAELLMSIFYPGSPLHDGAVIIDKGTIRAASCVLPLSLTIKQGTLGTRHKAALGISEHTDAVAVAVSEERGSISVAEHGKLDLHIHPSELEHRLTKLLGARHEQGKLFGFLKRITKKGDRTNHGT